MPVDSRTPLYRNRVSAKSPAKRIRNAAPGLEADREQVLAANVDTAFLVTALTHDLNPRRLERYRDQNVSTA